MPRHKPPKTDELMIVVLHKAAAAIEQDRIRGLAYLSDADMAQVMEAVHGFESINTAVNDSRSDRVRAVERAQALAADLKAEVRSVWRSLNSYIGRGKAPNGYFTDFGLPKSGDVPQEGGRAVWFSRSAQALHGADKLVQDGYELPFNVELLRQIHEDARTAYAEVETLKGSVQSAESERRRLRQQAKDAYKRVHMELGYALRREEPQTVRAVMRRYGILFQYAPGEEALDQAEDPDQNTDMADSYAVMSGAPESLHRSARTQPEPEESRASHQNGAAVTSA